MYAAWLHKKYDYANYYIYFKFNAVSAQKTSVPNFSSQSTEKIVLYSQRYEFNQNNSLFQNGVNNNIWATTSDSNERGEYKA